MDPEDMSEYKRQRQRDHAKRSYYKRVVRCVTKPFHACQNMRFSSVSVGSRVTCWLCNCLIDDCRKP